MRPKTHCFFGNSHEIRDWSSIKEAILTTLLLTGCDEREFLPIQSVLTLPLTPHR